MSGIYEIHVTKRLTQPVPAQNSSGLLLYLFKTIAHSPSQTQKAYQEVIKAFPEPDYKVDVIRVETVETEITEEVKRIMRIAK